MADTQTQQQTIASSRDTIRLQLINDLQSYSTLKNINPYQTSFASYVIDELSVLSQNLLFYDSMLYKERFLNTAQRYESINDLTRQIGYQIPKAVPSEMQVTFWLPAEQLAEGDIIDSLNKNYTISCGDLVFRPKYDIQAFNSGKYGYSPTMTTSGLVVVDNETGKIYKSSVVPGSQTMNQKFYTFTVPFIQTEEILYSFNVPEDLSNLQFYSEKVNLNNGKQLSGLKVFIIPQTYSDYGTIAAFQTAKEFYDYYETNESIIQYMWTETENGLFDLTQQSTEYSLSSYYDNFVLQFGNGVIGKQPENQALILCLCEVTNGYAGNITPAQVTTFDNIQVIRGSRHQSLSGISVNNVISSTGGVDYPTIPEIRQYALDYQLAKERLVSWDDYNNFSQIVQGTPFEDVITMLKRSDLKSNDIAIYTTMSFSNPVTGQNDIVPTRSVTFPILKTNELNIQMPSVKYCADFNVPQRYGLLNNGLVFEKYPINVNCIIQTDVTFWDNAVMENGSDIAEYNTYVPLSFMSADIAKMLTSQEYAAANGGSQSYYGIEYDPNGGELQVNSNGLRTLYYNGIITLEEYKTYIEKYQTTGSILGLTNNSRKYPFLWGADTFIYTDPDGNDYTIKSGDIILVINQERQTNGYYIVTDNSIEIDIPNGDGTSYTVVYNNIWEKFYTVESDVQGYVSPVLYSRTNPVYYEQNATLIIKDTPKTITKWKYNGVEENITVPIYSDELNCAYDGYYSELNLLSYYYDCSLCVDILDAAKQTATSVPQWIGVWQPYNKIYTAIQSYSNVAAAQIEPIQEQAGLSINLNERTISGLITIDGYNIQGNDIILIKDGLQFEKDGETLIDYSYNGTYYISTDSVHTWYKFFNYNQVGKALINTHNSGYGYSAYLQYCVDDNGVRQLSVKGNSIIKQSYNLRSYTVKNGNINKNLIFYNQDNKWSLFTDIDGYYLNNNDLVILVNQTNSNENGIYKVTTRSWEKQYINANNQYFSLKNCNPFIYISKTRTSSMQELYPNDRFPHTGDICLVPNDNYENDVETWNINTNIYGSYNVDITGEPIGYWLFHDDTQNKTIYYTTSGIRCNVFDNMGYYFQNLQLPPSKYHAFIIDAPNNLFTMTINPVFATGLGYNNIIGNLYYTNEIVNMENGVDMITDKKISKFVKVLYGNEYIESYFSFINSNNETLSMTTTYDEIKNGIYDYDVSQTFYNLIPAGTKIPQIDGFENNNYMQTMFDIYIDRTYNRAECQYLVKQSTVPTNMKQINEIDKTVIGTYYINIPYVSVKTTGYTNRILQFTAGVDYISTDDHFPGTSYVFYLRQKNKKINYEMVKQTDNGLVTGDITSVSYMIKPQAFSSGELDMVISVYKLNVQSGGQTIQNVHLYDFDFKMIIKQDLSNYMNCYMSENWTTNDDSLLLLHGVPSVASDYISELEQYDARYPQTSGQAIDSFEATCLQKILMAVDSAEICMISDKMNVQFADTYGYHTNMKYNPQDLQDIYTIYKSSKYIINLPPSEGGPKVNEGFIINETEIYREYSDNTSTYLDKNYTEWGSQFGYIAICSTEQQRNPDGQLMYDIGSMYQIIVPTKGYMVKQYDDIAITKSLDYQPMVYDGLNWNIAQFDIPIFVQVDVVKDPQVKINDADLVANIQQAVASLNNDLGLEKDLYISDITRVISDTDGVLACNVVYPKVDIVKNYDHNKFTSIKDTFDFQPQMVAVSENSVNVNIVQRLV